MSRGRIVEYTNELSNGPVGFEYPLPLDSDKPSDLSAWIQQFADLHPEDVFSPLSRQWEPPNAITKPVVDFFSTLEPASIYLLPWDHDCSEITICFEGTSEFVRAFTAFYSGIDTQENSPFFY